MNLETLINVILVIFFLLFTLLSKALASRKKKTTGIQKKLSKNPLFSFFQKIKDRVQESIQELEKQARQEKQKQSADTGFWDEMAEQEWTAGELAEHETPAEAESPSVASQSPAIEERQTQKHPPKRPEKKLSDQTVPPPTIHPYGRRPSLRQAVIWAEIIGKPAALRKDHSDFII